MQITISGYPLPGTVTISNARPDEHIHGEGWLLDLEQATHLLDAWQHAPTGHSDVARAWAYYEVGMIVTALHLDGEVTISGWESAIGSDGADLYSTVNMPFDFDIRPTGADTPPEPLHTQPGARR